VTGQPSDEREVLDLLDDYLRRLHAGEQPDRRRLLDEHPELAPALACLDVLDGIASDLVEASKPPGETLAGDFADATTASAEVPREFGAYELLEEIGRGGMGVVYKARQKCLDRTVAVKMILAGHLASPEHVRRFRAEAKVAAALRHPHIVDVHEVGELHGRHYFVMEYVDGTSLAERIASGEMEIEPAVRLMAQVARAVGELHRLGIVHRDLKPSNILLDAESRPYVTDFGLAKMFVPGSDVQTTTGAILGTATYMAPEQAAGHSAEATPASDVYSLGAILYEMLTGRPPFHADSPLDTLMQVLTREPTLPRRLNRRIPRPLELIALRCLSKSPADRYDSAEALADDLERFLKGETLAARPPGPIQRFWNWSRREPALAARLGVLGIFFTVHTINTACGELDIEFVTRMYLLMAVWVVTAVVCQQLLKIPRWSLSARFVWGTLDSALLFAVLLFANGAASPLIVAYPLLIVGSGLWFRVRFVWFITILSLVSYGAHVLDFFLRRTELHALLDARWDRHVIFAAALIVMGAGVGHLVQRVRVLSTYCGQKP